MGDRRFQQELKEYLINAFQEIEHPADPFDVSRRLPLDAKSATDALLALLRLPTDVAEAQGLERRVLSSFREYLSARETDVERRVHATSNLVLRLEPFLKKLHALRYPDRALPSRRVLQKLLRDVAGYQGAEFLFKPTEKNLLNTLRRQRTEDAILHDAYCFRNIEAHEAKTFLPVREQRCWRSVVGAFLLIALRNIALVPDVEKRMKRAARFRFGLRTCLENMRGRFDDTKWRNEYYIPLSIDQSGRLDKYVSAFLRDDADRLLVIAGRTGAGKSTFLERLTTELADQALTDLTTESAERILIPVHLELKRYVPTKRMYLVKKLYHEFDPGKTLEIGTRRVARWPQVISPTGLLVCLLDGLDEVPAQTYREVVSMAIH